MRIIFLGLILLVLSGCASTAAKSYVGKSIDEAYFELGPPENIIALTDGRKAYQHRWGGGTYSTPARSSSVVTATSRNTATIETVSTPAQVYESAGCLITLIARENDSKVWVVEEWRIPKKMVC